MLDIKDKKEKYRGWSTVKPHDIQPLFFFFSHKSKKIQRMFNDAPHVSLMAGASKFAVALQALCSLIPSTSASAPHRSQIPMSEYPPQQPDGHRRIEGPVTRGSIITGAGHLQQRQWQKTSTFLLR